MQKQRIRHDTQQMEEIVNASFAKNVTEEKCTMFKVTLELCNVAMGHALS